MKRLECKHCGYTWVSSSLLANVSCPSCLLKTENKAVVVDAKALDEVTQEVTEE